MLFVHKTLHGAELPFTDWGNLGAKQCEHAKALMLCTYFPICLTHPYHHKIPYFFVICYYFYDTESCIPQAP